MEIAPRKRRTAYRFISITSGTMKFELVDAKLVLHFFQRDAGGFRVVEEDEDEVDGHHGGEEHEGVGAGGLRHDGKEERDEHVPDPVRGAAESLTLGAHAVGKDLADVDPEHRALRHGEGGDERHQQPDEPVQMGVGVKDVGDEAETDAEADGADEQQLLAAELVDDRHGQQGKDQVGGSDGDGLQVSGDFGRAGESEDVVQVIEDGVDAGELAEHADGKGDDDGLEVLTGEQWVRSAGAFQMHGGDDFVQLLLSLRHAGEFQDGERFVQAGLRDQPARAARDDKEGDEKKHRRDGGDAEHPSPLQGAKMPAADDGIRHIGEQDADDDVDLEESDQAAAPVWRRNLRDVHRAENGGATDTEAAEEAKEDECWPAPGKGAADGGDHIEDGHDAETVAATVFLSWDAGAHGADDRAGQCAGDGDAEQDGREVINLRQGGGGAGNDGGIEPEQQATKRAYDRALDYVRIDAHSVSKVRIFAAIARRVGRMCPSRMPGESGLPRDK